MVIRSQGAIAAGLALCVLLAPAASWAGSPSPQAQTTASARPLAASVSAAVARADLAAAQDTTPPPTSSSGRSFFGSTKGKVAIALMTGAVVIIAVSRNKDAVHSPAR